jgi:peptidoglycan/LPS O-acetylase OafA/YrhL
VKRSRTRRRAALPISRPRRTDISYGVYLYHFPIINIILVRLSRPYLPVHAVLVVVATTILALLSWHLIEKRALRLKARGTRLLRNPQVQTLPDGPVVRRA